MTKKEIVRQIAERIHETQLKTKEIVQLTFDAIVDTLIRDRRIELRNFGVFEVKLRKGRRARNPRTDTPVDVPPKFAVTFKPGKEMEDRVRHLVPTAAELAALEQKKEKKQTAAPAAPATTAAPAAPSPLPAPATPPPAPASPSATNGSGEDGVDAQPQKKKTPRKKTAQA